MSTIVVLAVLLSALLHASWNALVKGGNDRWLTSGMIGGFGGIGALLVALLFLPLPQLHHWPWLIGSGALHATWNPEKWKGDRLWIVALYGDIAIGDDKLGARKREIVAEIL